MSSSGDRDGPTVLLSETYDRTSAESLSSRIVRLVAVASGREPTDLEPLGNVVEPEALDRLLDSRSVEDPERGIAVTFIYEEYRVEIDADGTVSILVEDE